MTVSGILPSGGHDEYKYVPVEAAGVRMDRGTHRTPLSILAKVTAIPDAAEKHRAVVLSNSAPFASPDTPTMVETGIHTNS